MRDDKDLDTPPARVLFAIGTANYTEPEYTEPAKRQQEPDSLNQAVPRSLSAVVETFTQARVEAKLPPPGYLLDPDTEQLRDTFAQVGGEGDINIVYYIGHGDELGPDGYYLITKDFTKPQRRRKGVKAAELPGWMVKRRDNGGIEAQQPPTLLILDCCFSGTAGLEVLRDAVLDGTHPNLWVWATATTTQYAISGVFAKALTDLLRRPRVGASMEHVPLETVLDTIDGALHGTGQQAQMYSAPGFPRLPRFFPNRDYTPHVAGLTVALQHWISKARGAPQTAESGFYLTGRTGRVRAALNLARWITSPAEGDVAVVTGSPGSGKSALLSLPTLLTDPAGRELLLTGTPARSLAHQTAELLTVDTDIVAVHARGLNTDQVAQAIAAGVGRSATAAVSLLESFDENPPRQAPVVVVDALDEATAPARLRDSLLVPLAVQHRLRMVLGARRHVLPAPGTAATTVIDLDTEDYRDPEALIEYVRELLVAAHEPGVQTPYQVAASEMTRTTQTIAAAIAERATARPGLADTLAESFLIARMIALAVRDRPEPVDITVEGWTQRLPNGLAQAFEEDLNRLGERTPTARALLAALAWARGPGLPWETVWVPVARALAIRRGDIGLAETLTDEDIRWLLDSAGAYIVEDLGPGRRSVFRPFHDRLAEYLRGGGGDDADPARSEAAVVAALLDTLGPQGGRRWNRTHPYLRTYLAEHADAAGTEVFSAVLGDSGFLAVADPATLTPLLFHAPTEQKRIVRAYRRARPLLGDDPAANAAYLQEANRADTATPMSIAGTGISPIYRTRWTSIRPDHSLLTLTGHTGSVESVAFGVGAGGRPLLASAGDDRTVRLWDPNTGGAVGVPLTGHTGTVWSVAFGVGAGGRPLLASAGDDRTVRLWDPDTGGPVGVPLTAHTGMVWSVAFGVGAGGRPLLAWAGPNGVRLWDFDAGEPVGVPLAGGTVVSVAFGVGAGGRPLLAWAGFNGVRLWDVDAGEPVGVPLTADSVWSVAFGVGAGGRPLLAWAGPDGVRLWDVDAGEPVRVLWTGGRVVAFGVGAGGRRLLASAGDDRTVRLWDPDTGGLVGVPLTGHTDSVWSVAFGVGAGGRPLLASAGNDRTVRLWDPDTGGLVSVPFTGHTGTVWSVAFGVGAGGRPLLASAGNDRTVRLWDRDTGELVGVPLTGHTGTVVSVAFGVGAGGRPLLGSAGSDGTVRLWDPDAGGPVGVPLTGHTGTVRSVAFGVGAGGRPLLGSAGDDGTVRLWDPDAGEPVGVPLTGGWVESVAFGVGAAGRPLLASAGDDGTVRLWDPDTGEPVGVPLTGHTGTVESVAFGVGAAGRPLLASAGDDGTVRLWDPDTGEPVGVPLTGHTGTVESVAFGAGAAGRPLLASAGDDGTVRLWDPDTGACLITIRRRVDARALAIDGPLIAIGDTESLSVIDVC